MKSKEIQERDDIDSLYSSSRYFVCDYAKNTLHTRNKFNNMIIRAPLF